MELVLIAAIAANGVIGREGTLPWHFPEDLAHFKETTMGHPVIMGRVAFEDIMEMLGEPLPGRTNIVLTRGAISFPPGVIRAGGIDEAVAAARETDAETAYVAGGATVYAQFLPRADRMLLTELHEAHEGDVSFPDWEPDRWRERSRQSHESFDIVEYVRIGAA